MEKQTRFFAKFFSVVREDLIVKRFIELNQKAELGLSRVNARKNIPVRGQSTCREWWEIMCNKQQVAEPGGAHGYLGVCIPAGHYGLFPPQTPPPCPPPASCFNK